MTGGVTGGQVLRVGVVGAGAMGTSHVRMLAGWVPAARVSAVHDADTARSAEAAEAVGAVAFGTADELIGSPDVDAVVIASPDPMHAEQVLACLQAGKPVLCEKPLAADLAGSRQILELEAAAAERVGRQLVQVGFMRRYDPAYVALKAHVAGGAIGSPRVVHCVHRNPAAHPTASTEGIVVNSMIHELDCVPWLLDDPVAAITVRVARPAGGGALGDPQVALLELASGAIATVEVFVNAGYGYDVQCEVVGDTGTAGLTAPYGVGVRGSLGDAGVAGVQVTRDFVARFADAYRLELSGWVAGTLRGVVDGPGAAEGHRANLVAAAGVESLRTGLRVEVGSG